MRISKLNCNKVSFLNDYFKKNNLTTFIKQLKKNGTVVLVGSTARNLIDSDNVNGRDLDLVIILKSGVSLKNIISSFDFKEIIANSLGGYKIITDKIDIDIWDIFNTYAFKNHLVQCNNPIIDYLNTVYYSYDKLLVDLSNSIIYDDRKLNPIEIVNNSCPIKSKIKQYIKLAKYINNGGYVVSEAVKNDINNTKKSFKSYDVIYHELLENLSKNKNEQKSNIN